MITEHRRVATMPWIMLSMVSLPFVVLVWLLITSASDHLQHYRRLQQIVDVFDAGQGVLRPMEDMAAYGPAHILIGGPEFGQLFSEARDQVPAALQRFQSALSEVGDPATSDYAEMLQADWAAIDMTTSTSSTMDPYDAVGRLLERVYRSMTSLIYFLEIDAGDDIHVSELLMLSVEDMQSARDHAGALHALTLFVARRGGYVGSADAERLEQAWTGLQSDLQGLQRRLSSLNSRGLDSSVAQNFQRGLESMRAYLDYIDENVLLADRITLSWQDADRRGHDLSDALHQLSADQLLTARQLLQRSRSNQLLRDLLLAAGLFALYITVSGIGLLFYRSREQMLHALAESKTKSQFLARMSHEIRTPLNGVIGLAELLRETNPDSRQREYISLIDSAGRSLISLVNDILDYAKIEAGKLQLDVDEFDLRGLIEETTQMFSLQVNENHNLLLSMVGDEVPALLRGDATRIRQVLINLIGNAVKFTRRGWIEIRVSHRRHLDGQVLLRFEVQDSGIGLSPDEQRQLFGMFSQASADVARRYGGTGLGLSISRELVRLMGGDIDVISARNWGSTFWFDLALPVVSTTSAQTIAPLPLQQPVLLIDVSGAMSRLVRAAGDVLEPVEAVTSFRAAEQLLHQDREFGLLVFYFDEQSHADGLLSQHLQQARALAVRCGGRLRLVTGVRGDVPGRAVSSGNIEESLVNRSVYSLAQLLDVFSAEPARDLPAAASADGGDEASLASFPHLRVLVAEDNPVNQLVTRGYLARLRIEPDLVEDGRAAVQRYRELQGGFDVILMDLDMPLLDGPGASRQIRALEQANGWRRCHILALSAHALPEYGEQVLQAGMDGQLVKPVTVSQLAEALAHVAGPQS